YPRGRPKRRTVNGERECTLRILGGRKGLATKLSPTGGRRTPLSTASSCQPARSDGSKDAVLFRTVKMDAPNGWSASTSMSPNEDGRNRHSQTVTGNLSVVEKPRWSEASQSI